MSSSHLLISKPWVTNELCQWAFPIRNSRCPSVSMPVIYVQQFKRTLLNFLSRVIQFFINDILGCSWRHQYWRRVYPILNSVPAYIDIILETNSRCFIYGLGKTRNDFMKRLIATKKIYCHTEQKAKCPLKTTSLSAATTVSSVGTNTTRTRWLSPKKHAAFVSESNREVSQIPSHPHYSRRCLFAMFTPCPVKGVSWW